MLGSNHKMFIIVVDLYMFQGDIKHLNSRNFKMKWFTSQQLLVLRQNRLHQCVHHVVRIIRKIVACRFEQLCDLIFLQS